MLGLFCWNGIAVVGWDLIMQVYFVRKFIELEINKSKEDKEGNEGTMKSLAILYVYYAAMCLLICTFSTLTISRLVLASD